MTLQDAVGFAVAFAAAFACQRREIFVWLELWCVEHPTHVGEELLLCW